MNWDDANAWNSAADGSGTNYTNPQNGGGTTYLCYLNGKTVTVNIAVAVDQIVGSVSGVLSVPDGASALITVATATAGITIPLGSVGILTWAGASASSLTINGDVNYSGTSTSGMFPYTTNQAITLNGKVTNTSSGYCFVGSGSGVLTISNVGGTAISCSGSGRGVSHASTGAMTVTGAMSNTSSGRCISVNAATTCSITGSGSNSGVSGYVAAFTAAGITATFTGDVTVSTGTGLFINNGSLSIVGNLSSSANGVALNVGGGACTWIGSRALAASADCKITLTGGTLNLATASGALSLANSGTVVIDKTGGTLTTTSGANTASIALQSATAYAAIPGGSDENKAIITGASIPSAADTRYGVARGWADGGTSATAGCGVAGGNGLLEIPNSGTPTGTQDSTSDDCVVSGKKYGSPQRTGTASGGSTVIINVAMNGGMNG